MDINSLFTRSPQPAPWAEGEKIPWNEPEFSLRMLAEHLTQAHDMASRRFEIIERQVEWIHTHLLEGRPGRVLDLGCGPGLYTARLAALGHTCLGLDFSPASIEYARQASAGLSCEYRLEDLRQAEFGDGYDLVMLIFGELNTFRPAEARQIIGKARQALKAGGRLLLEPHSYAAVQAEGQRPSEWYTSKSGLFSAEPHLMLMENFWDGGQAVATNRFIVMAADGRLTPYGSSMQAYTTEGYRRLLEEAGFSQVVFHPGLSPTDPSPGLIAINAVAEG